MKLHKIDNDFRFGVYPFGYHANYGGELLGFHPRNSLVLMVTLQKKSLGITKSDGGLILGEGIKTIGKNCFRNNARLKFIVLKEGIETIEEHAFWNAKIKEIAIPKSVKSIRKNSFSPEILLRVHEGSYGEKYAKRWGFHYEVLPKTEAEERKKEDDNE